MVRRWSIHEQGKDFHDVVQPSVGAASVSQGADQSLRNDSTDLTGSSAHTVGGGTIPGGEDFARDDESRSVGTEILEEVAETIKSEESPGWDFVEAETDDAEENGKHSKAAHLDRFSTDSIDGCNRDPIARDETRARQN